MLKLLCLDCLYYSSAILFTDTNMLLMDVCIVGSFTVFTIFIYTISQIYFNSPNSVLVTLMCVMLGSSAFEDALCKHHLITTNCSNFYFNNILLYLLQY